MIIVVVWDALLGRFADVINRFERQGVASPSREFAYRLRLISDGRSAATEVSWPCVESNCLGSVEILIRRHVLGAVLNTKRKSVTELFQLNKIGRIRRLHVKRRVRLYRIVSFLRNLPSYGSLAAYARSHGLSSHSKILLGLSTPQNSTALLCIVHSLLIAPHREHSNGTSHKEQLNSLIRFHRPDYGGLCGG